MNPFRQTRDLWERLINRNPPAPNQNDEHSSRHSTPIEEGGEVIIGDDDTNSENGSTEETTNGADGQRRKKTRTVFSRSQVFQLESTFDAKRYLSSAERSTLAVALRLTETQVCNIGKTLKAMHCR